MRSLTCRRSYPAFAGKTKDSVWYEVFRRDRNLITATGYNFFGSGNRPLFGLRFNVRVRNHRASTRFVRIQVCADNARRRGPLPASPISAK